MSKNEISARLARSAKVGYESFIFHAGFQNDARIKPWNKLDHAFQTRWVAIAKSVVDTYNESAETGVPDGKENKAKPARKNTTKGRNSARNAHSATRSKSSAGAARAKGELPAGIRALHGGARRSRAAGSNKRR